MTVLPEETELKLWLRPEDAKSFPALPRLKHARPHEMELRTIYFDTPNFKLAEKGIALRVRAIGKRWVQTLKTEGQRSGGLSSRLELETPVQGPFPELSRLPSEMTDRLVRLKWREKLVPVFETRFHRTAWNLRTPDHGRVEVALDVGHIAAGDKTEALHEVELELRSGRVEALYDLARVLMQDVLLLPFDASKAERGSRLARGGSCQPLGAIKIEIDKTLPVCTAFAMIARACLAHFQANLPGLLMAEDPEYLHQARVAIRRLRSAIRLFRQACPPPAEELERIADLGRALGFARDWDVFVLATLPALLDQYPSEQRTLLLRRAKAYRRKARDQALLLAARPQTAADLLVLHRWLDDLLRWPGKGDLPHFARKKLARLHTDILTGAARFAEASPKQRHLLRIRVKRLRYALDDLGSLFGGHKRFADCFTKLQDELGGLNDSITAQNFLKQLNRDGRLDSIAANLGSRLATRMQDLGKDAAATLRKFSRLQPPW